MAEATLAYGGAVALVVLTASHQRETPLAEIRALVQGASSRSRKGKAWERERARYGILGVIVGREVTFSRENGPHDHEHLSVPVSGPTPAERARAKARGWSLERIVKARALRAAMTIARRYKAEVRKAGGKVSDRHGTYCRVAENAADASDYTAKGSMAWEVAGGPTKDRTKAEESMTPWDVAESAHAGDAWARHRWAEYVEVMPGTRSCVVSAALAEKLMIDREAKPEGGEQVLEEPDEVVGDVEAPVWKKWMRFGLVSTFLARVEFECGHEGGRGFSYAVERTQADARVLEDRYAARDARRRAEADAAQRTRSDRQQDALLKVAVGRIRRSGNRTLDHVNRVCDNIAEQVPDAARLRPEDVVRALATLPETTPQPCAWDDVLYAEAA